jgi:hypothetical protein
MATHQNLIYDCMTYLERQTNHLPNQDWTASIICLSIKYSNLGNFGDLTQDLTNRSQALG